MAFNHASRATFLHSDNYNVHLYTHTHRGNYNVHSYTHTETHAHTHTHMQTYTHTCTLAHTNRYHTHTHTHMQTYTHTCTLAHTHTHTHTIATYLQFIQFPRFMTAGCGCRRNCTSHFSKDHVLEVRAQCHELTRENLDMALLGQLMACLNISDSVVTECRHAETPRHRSRANYSHQGRQVCTAMFRTLHNVGKSCSHTHTHTYTHTHTTSVSEHVHEPSMSVLYRTHQDGGSTQTLQGMWSGA